ncbi:ATP-binding cassette domain-containing protein [Shimia sp. SDUM112013]|uniref:ABC transporter ATP-binding protein/permease n=1 Tax=Shimia sp. SDUM112013 TaxID=3136160 RepID=UPI0032ECB11B
MKRTKPQKSATLRRIDAAAGPGLRRASGLLVLASLMWPVQAAAAALLIQSWVNGQLNAAGISIAVFVLGGLLRAFLEQRAGGVLFDLADEIVSGERHQILAREVRRDVQVTTSAELAALISQKLPMLVPYLTRYKPAMARVRFVPLVLLGISFWFSWAVGLIFLVAGPLIPVFMALIGIAAKDASDRQMVEVGDMNRLLMDRLSALGDIRLLDATEQAEKDFADRAEGLRSRTMAVLRIAFLSSTVLELFAAIGVAMVAVFVGFSLLGEITFGVWDSGLSLAEGVFLLLIAPEFFQPLRDMAAAWHDRAGAMSVMDEMDKLETIRSQQIPGQGAQVAALDGPANITSERTVVLRGTTPVALPDLAVSPGEAVALVGDSGAGKTTCLLGLAGLVPLESGHVTVAGTNLTEDTADAWRRRVAFIPQLVHLPDCPLRDFLDPDGTGRDLAEALAAARADAVVASLPEGLETRLGETGAGVSGGEARRLLVARAIFRGADVILADEPTADLDPDTTQQLVEVFLRLARQGAVVVIATHDPAVVQHMDRTITVEGHA